MGAHAIRLLFAAVCAVSLPAAAQDAFFESINQGAVDYAGTLANNSMLDAVEDDDPPDEDRPSADRGAQFRPSAAVRRQVERRFVEAFGARVPSRRARFAEEIADGRARAPFQAVLDRHGLSSNDFADVAAGYFIAMWSVVHDRPVSAREAAPAIAQLRKITLSSPGALPPTDVDRQTISDAKGLYAGIVLGQYARSAGDPAARERLRRRVAEHARAQGMDLQALALTVDGFRVASARP